MKLREKLTELKRGFPVIDSWVRSWVAGLNLGYPENPPLKPS